MSHKRTTPETVSSSVKNKVMSLAGVKASKTIKQLKNSLKEPVPVAATSSYQFLYW
jgi:hypothetical protein